MLILLTPVYNSFANNIDIQSKLAQDLRNEGFRNIQISNEGADLIVGLENNVYRFEADALTRAIKIIYKFAGTHKNIVLIAKKLQLPIITIKISVEKLNSFSSGAISEKEFSNSIQIDFSSSDEWKKLRQEKIFNKNTFDLDFVIEPKIGFQLGNYDYPLRYQFRLLPSIETSLWKGQKIIGQFSIPVFDRHYVDQYKYFRPNIISIEQNFRIRKGLYTKLTAGWFTEKRYGFDAELVQYLFDGRLLLRGNFGYTGYILYLKKGAKGLSERVYSKPTIEIDSPDYFQFFGNIEYRIEKYDLAINISYGKYLYENDAFLLNIYRNFNEYTLGFQAHFSETGHNFGFRIFVPLWPEKYFKNKNIRIRPSKYINYSYLATRDYIDTYRTSNVINEVIRELNPLFVKHFIAKNLLSNK
ncbi:MAG: YjbH domain-containing protein [Bacteroidota bacterium]|nr:YjbH domain-containing protein [Bacteroidota bacterium]